MCYSWNSTSITNHNQKVTKSIIKSSALFDYNIFLRNGWNYFQKTVLIIQMKAESRAERFSKSQTDSKNIDRSEDRSRAANSFLQGNIFSMHVYSCINQQLPTAKLSRLRCQTDSGEGRQQLTLKFLSLSSAISLSLSLSLWHKYYLSLFLYLSIHDTPLSLSHIRTISP